MLSLRDVHLHIGKLHILQGVTLEVKPGESAALLGRNGVGKTTTLRAIMGLTARSGGRIEFDGTDLSSLAPHKVPRLGIGYVPQGRGIFPNLSVLENLNIGTQGKRDTEREDYVFDCFPRLKERLKQSGNTLSGGEQQMLAIARGLMARPQVLMLDEPSLGLAPKLLENLYDLLAALRDEGITILLVDQMAQLALSVADRAYVLQSGAFTHSGTAREVTQDPALVKAYLGGHGALL